MFQVLDISDPANPKIVGELLTDAQIYSVTISGNYAYIVNPFRIIDISDPANPALVSSIDSLPAAYPANNVKVKGNYAYLGDWGGFITIIDISNPSNPQTLGLMNVPGDGVSDLAVKDTIIYAKSVDNFGIYVFNITNPDSPSQVTIINSYLSGVLRIAGNFLYNGTSSTFTIYDISNPANPRYVNEVDISSSGSLTTNISVLDTIAYLTLYSGGIAEIDIADPNNISVISHLNGPYGLTPVGEDVSFPYDYVAGGTGLWTVNVQNPDSMSSVSFFPTGGNVNKMTVDSSYHAYLAELSAGLKILDFSSPSSPKLVGYYLTNEEVIDVAVSGGYAYLDCDSDLQVLDVSNPSSPKFVSKVLFNDTLHSNNFLCLDGSELFDTRASEKLYAIDISDPQKPKVESTVPLRGIPAGLSQSNDYLYAAIVETGIQVFNISKPNTPIDSAFLKVAGLGGLTTYKNSLFAMGDDTTLKQYGLERYDITNPVNPLFKYFVHTPGGFVTPTDIKVDKYYAYVNTGLYTEGNTLYAISISNQDSGGIIYSASTPSQQGYDFNSIVVYNGIILTGYLGVDIFKNNLITEITTSTTTPNNFELYQNYPNPFNPSTTINYQIPKGGMVIIKIYDILGREIKTLVNGYKPAGRYNVTFNAHNLASGVYIYQLKSGSFVASKKLVLIK